MNRMKKLLKIVRLVAQQLVEARELLSRFGMLMFGEDR